MTLAIFFAGMLSGVAGTVSMCALVAAGRADRAAEAVADRDRRLAEWAEIERGRDLARGILRELGDDR